MSLTHWMLSRRGGVLLVWALILIPCIAGLSKFRLDTSSDSLVLDQDADLRYYDETRLTFGSDSSLVVVVRPQAELFQTDTLERIEALAADIDEVPGVASVLGVTRVPLFLNPPAGLFRLADGFRTIADDPVDLDIAKAEVLRNPLYAGALVSENAQVTALQVSLTAETELLSLEHERYRLRDLEQSGNASSEEVSLLREIERQFKSENLAAADRRRELISELRSVIEPHRDLGLVEIGGLPMISVDIVRYIERDLAIFGISSLVFILFAVWILFREVAWTIAITVNCVLTVLALLGILGWMDWRVTVVTSNLASLLFILTLAMSIHVGIRFREQYREVGGAQESAMGETLAHVFTPCLFTVLTTMVGFGSLYLSKLRPVMDFSSMMALGLALAFACTFTLLPALALLIGIKKGEAGLTAARATDAEGEGQVSVYERVARWTQNNRLPIVTAGLLVAIVSVLGVLRLGVENSFVDYFKESTPIHRSLTLIDENLGGTTPLEIVLESERTDAWLEMDNLATLSEIHEWLEDQPELGHVSSLHSMIQILQQIIDADPNPALRNAQINTFLLKTMRSRLPEDLARTVLQPFVSSDYSQTRITARVKESTAGLDREALLQRIEKYLRTPEDPQGTTTKNVTGMFVLYNNMLQSLLQSQVSTLLAVLLAIAAMFWLLLRSVRLALIALVPNVLPVTIVLGALGWAQIPLDMMTIMIAAITLGISVDDTVHYLYRLRRESARGDFTQAVVRSHDTVGRAMMATTVAVAFGFSTLAVSNFKPTVYFGLLTGVAMVAALLADGLLLPALLTSKHFRTNSKEANP